MSRHEALVLVGGLAILVIMLIVARVRSDRRARKWAKAITRRIDRVEKGLSVVREECAHAGMVQDTRITIVERRLQAVEAPKPMETILDNDEEE